MINEINYHPAVRDEREEFLELFNTTGRRPIDLSGWCFVDGITGLLRRGHGDHRGRLRLAVAPNAAKFTAKYGGTPARRVLRRLDRTAVSDCVSSTAAGAPSTTSPTATTTRGRPRPTAPVPASSASIPSSPATRRANWRASTAASGNTLRAVNTAKTTGLLPIFTGVTHTVLPAAGAPVPVSARLTGATSAQLIYRVDFGNEVTIPFLDNGTSGDGAAGDGVFGAAIPGQVAGSLIRYRLTTAATNPSMTWPRPDDTVKYSGTTVAKTIGTVLPVFQWFINPTDYADALSHRNTDQTDAAVFAYGGQIIDNTQIRVRGSVVARLAEAQLELRLPAGSRPRGAGHPAGGRRLDEPAERLQRQERRAGVAGVADLRALG